MNTNHNDKLDQGLQTLGFADLQAVAGGWCGTLYPGFWKGPRPGPTPEPLLGALVSRASMVSLNPQPLPPGEMPGVLGF